MEVLRRVERCIVRDRPPIHLQHSPSLPKPHREQEMILELKDDGWKNRRVFVRATVCLQCRMRCASARSQNERVPLRVRSALDFFCMASHSTRFVRIRMARPLRANCREGECRSHIYERRMPQSPTMRAFVRPKFADMSGLSLATASWHFPRKSRQICVQVDQHALDLRRTALRKMLEFQSLRAVHEV